MPLPTIPAYLVASLLVAAPVVGSAAESKLTPAQAEFFEAKIRPIFAGVCYKCHSAEAERIKGGLLLDSRDGLLKGGEHGPAMTPGDPEKSLMIKAVRYSDPDLQMPPKGEKLSDHQIADLEHWVKMGAPDPRTATGAVAGRLSGLNDKARAHWAYQPVGRPAVPAVKQKDWVRTPVDAFILARLEQANLTPSRPADKTTLIRRAYYDLIGLPPTPQEVASFVDDDSPQAFAKVVDGLLASSHYGERWGRYWLDTARYADTSAGPGEGSRRTEYRYPYAWTYRDYVIRSFNDDKPYDQFVLEQVAADKLPGHDPASLAALGFLTVGKRFPSLQDEINDRIDVVTKGLLGLTVACARCHDHMFDPIPTKDYYSLHGVFASCVEPREKPVAGITSTAQRDDYLRQRTGIESALRAAYYEKTASLNAEFRRKAAGYVLVSPVGRRLQKVSAESLQRRNDLIRKFDLDEKFVFYISAELINEPAKRRNGFAGNSIFGPWRDFVALAPEQFASKAKALAEEIATNANGKTNPRVAAAFKGASPESLEDVAEIYGRLFTEVDKEAAPFIAASAASRTPGEPLVDPDIGPLLCFPFRVEPATALEPLHVKDVTEGEGITRLYGLVGFFSALTQLDLTHPGAPGRAMVLADAPMPADSPVFIRGQAENKGPVVPRQFLDILAGPNRQPFKDGSGRLELARAIATNTNPLTARVMINRVWLHHFGEGFVPTPDDLGTQSSPPTHPDLLDYLAAKFMEEGWSLKKIHRLIMLSNVYQQSSDENPRYSEIDPFNRLLWRANLRRLDFEAERDTLLALSGRLEPAMGGKPVNITEEPYSYRRSIYGYIDRGNMPELMTHFDFPDPNMPNSKRNSTVVPQQALFLMNSAFAIDVARKLLTRPEVIAAPDASDRVRALYQLIYQRDPRPEEYRLAEVFLSVEAPRPAADFSHGTFAGNKGAGTAPSSDVPATSISAATKISPRAGVRNAGENVLRVPLSVWEEFAQALLLSNEASYVN